jgi:hypothetical protein
MAFLSQSVSQSVILVILNLCYIEPWDSMDFIPNRSNKIITLNSFLHNLIIFRNSHWDNQNVPHFHLYCTDL